MLVETMRLENKCVVKRTLGRSIVNLGGRSIHDLSGTGFERERRVS